METSFGVSKVTPPRLRRIVPRRRLMERLEQERDKKLLLILGQAAQGKSTLAASWVRTSKIPYAWVNLGIEESDPVNLVHLLVHALHYALKDPSLSSLRSCLTANNGPRAPVPLYRDWIREILRHLSAPVDIIFDGLDRLSVDAPSFDFLQVLCEEMPPEFHMVMLSRSRPPLEVQRLKTNQEMEVITNEQLAFNVEEIRAFFKAIWGIALRSDQARKIHEITEGWVGGLVLLSGFMSRLPETSREAYLSEAFAGQLRIEAFEYFGEQLFSTLPEATQKLLIQSSILETVEPEFLKRLLGMEQPEILLQELSNRNFFIQPVHDERSGLRYRYHQLFKDFLRVRLVSTFKTEDRSELLSNAGLVSEQKGRFEEAIGFFLEAGAFPEAARVIEKIGMELLKTGRTGDLSRWLEALPEDLTRERPWLLFYHSMTQRFAAAYEGGGFERSITLFEQAQNPRGILLALAYWIETIVFRGHFSIPLEPLLAKGEEMLQALDAEFHPYERALLWAQIGFAYIWSGVNQRKGLWASQNAYIAAKSIRDLPLQINTLSDALVASAALGEFSLNHEIRQKLEALIMKRSHPELRAIYLLKSLTSDIYRGNLKETSEQIRILHSEIERHGLISLSAVALYWDTYLKTYFEKFAEAEDCGNQLLNYASSMGNRSVEGLALLALGVSFYHKGDFERARQVILRSIQVASSQRTGLHYFLSAARVTMALLHSQAPREWSDEHIEDELNQALSFYINYSNHLSLVDAHLAMALFKWKQGEAEEAAKHLQAGFKIVREREFDHFMFISPRDLARACVLALELQIEGVEGLLASKLCDLAGPHLERLSKHASPEIAGRAFEIQKTIHYRDIPPLRIETLGGFHVFRGEVPIGNREWHGNQTRRLLKALVARGGHQVSRELLIEDLWPEVESPLGEQNFKVSLHRLRRVLEPALDKHFGSSYVHLENNFLSLNEALCRVDLSEYFTWIQEGARKAVQGDHRGALALYTKAEELFKGDFLQEELYCLWINQRREEVRRVHIALLWKMAGLYELQGSLKKAVTYSKKTIELEPLNEEAYQKLIILYAKWGIRTEALKIYEECKRVLQTELGLEPNAVTLALHRKVMAAG